MIAADVNRGNSVTTVDATIIKQCILGNPAANNLFNVFWRFPTQSWTPVLPPWGFPEQFNLTGVSTNQSGLDFYGVKIGDVVTTYADPASFNGSGTTPLVWHAEDHPLRAGDQLTVLFSADAFDNLAAWQFALHFDRERLQFDSLETLATWPLSAANFGLYEVEAGEIRSVWARDKGSDLAAGTAVFRLRFTVKQTGGWLSDALQLDEDILSGEAYTSRLSVAPVELSYFQSTSVGQTDSGGRGVLLLQNRPNPFSEATTIGFVLPEACDAALRVFDVNGRLLHEHSAWYAAGEHFVVFDFGAEGRSGVLRYELTTPRGVLAKKMVLVRD